MDPEFPRDFRRLILGRSVRVPSGEDGSGWHIPRSCVQLLKDFSEGVILTARAARGKFKHRKLRILDIMRGQKSLKDANHRRKTRTLYILPIGESAKYVMCKKIVEALVAFFAICWHHVIPKRPSVFLFECWADWVLRMISGKFDKTSIIRQRNRGAACLSRQVWSTYARRADAEHSRGLFVIRDLAAVVVLISD